MKISELIEQLRLYPQDGNARAYEGEVCGIIIEDSNGKEIAVIEAHGSDEYSELCFERGHP